MLKIDENKLPIKYILGIHTELATYPDGLDILYEKIKRHIGDKNYNFTKHATMKYHLKNADPKKVDEALEQLIKDGFIVQKNETEGKESYTIINNPFE
tara:strand:- start:8864 stop:9157 length:294 start_codon:yes stop_codon:yes gene_type:complete